MNSVRHYIFGIVCCALLAAGIKSIPISSGAMKTLLNRLCGILVVLSVISPLLKFEYPNLENLEGFIGSDSQTLIASGQQMAREQETEIITQQTRTYILDKAQALGAMIEAEVGLSDERPFVPVSVTIKGNLSPYARQVLENIIQNDLGIRKEDQLWISGIQSGK